MKVTPDLSVEFSDAKAEAVARKIAELQDLVEWLSKDMARIATRSVPINQVTAFAAQSMLGLTEILTPR